MFLKFFNKIEAGYLSHNNLFHNNVHASDVLQSCHYILSQTRVLNYFGDIDVFAAFLNCAIHDFQHDGFSQPYHQVARTDLAILYNDKSVHCNNSVSQAFSIALRDPGCNIFSGIGLDKYRQLRDHIIEISYGFDLALTHERTLYVKKMLRKTETPLSNSPLPILQHICHCCDIGHCAKSWSIHSRNAGSGLEEFFLEGDMANAKGFTVTFMTQRKISSVITNHVLFYDLIVEQSFLILSNCIVRIQEESNDFSVETDEEDDSSLNCDSDTDLSTRKPRTTSMTKDRYTNYDISLKRPTLLDQTFPWTFNIVENRRKWAEGGIYKHHLQKA